MNNRFLETKFHIPPWRAGGLARPRLLERLQGGLDERRKLTLVSAPAGYGKTTLVAEWLYSIADNSRIAWLSLDESDNDLSRFLGYWVASLRRANESLGTNAQNLLDMPQLPPLDSFLDGLINDLSALEDLMLLVLDDYHLIGNPKIHEALEYFLDHQPPQVHLVVTTREDPPFPLARMRARGQMTEIRVDDLRFTSQEAGQFFNQSMKLQLTPQLVDDLESRTEGWAVGLQLAGLALQSLPDPQEFIETFRGSHRYVLDYLAEEVLRQQGEDIRRFLARTSILERLNASLCNALTERSDSQAVLTRLEHSNLFIIPLDNERNWYRYHHLFADYLRTELTKPEMAELYKKAALWHEENDLVYEAVKYSLASMDTDFAADVIERALNRDTTWSGGNLTLLSSWLDVLPPQAFGSRPRLGLSSSRVLYLSGRFDLAEQRIDETEQILESLPDTPEREQMLALAALNRGSISAVRGDVKHAIEQTTFAQSRLPRDNHLAHARAFYDLGLAYEISSQTELAVKNYLQSSTEAKMAGVLFLAIHARGSAAQAQITLGQLRLAEQTCQEAIQFAAGRHMPPLGLAWMILGAIALERNDLVSAEQLLQKGIALAREGGLMDDVVLGLAFLARLHAHGDTANTLAAVQEVNSIMQVYGVQRMTVLASAYLARLQLSIGQTQSAAQWAVEVEPVRATISHEFIDLTLVRVLLATGELDTIPSILNPLLEKATAAGRMQTCIEAMLLLGLFHHAQKDSQSAVDWLGKSLRLAAPEGFVRVFLDEGKPLLDLLPKARPAAPEFVDSLLKQSQLEGKSRSAPLEQLPDPLSEQEIRVLKLIVAGKSNQQIADELVISVGTAKWHVHNVLQKLGVNNRPQAIARARELGI
ncbi:MAG: AAA family ATPase [Anaerolineales bacterium]|nr:AAA family ATPase [Anaerolineales bacterium]